MSGGRLASYFFGPGDPSGPARQRVERGIRVGSDVIPLDSAVARVGRSDIHLGGHPVAVRGGVIAFWDPPRSVLVILSDGERTEVEVPWDVGLLRIDADERVWAAVNGVDTGGEDQAWLVYDERGRELMRVNAWQVVDARGDWLLTSVWHDAAFEAVLHRRVR